MTTVIKRRFNLARKILLSLVKMDTKAKVEPVYETTLHPLNAKDFQCIKYSLIASLVLNIIVEIITAVIGFLKLHDVWSEEGFLLSSGTVVLVSFFGLYTVKSHNYKLCLVLSLFMMVIGLIRCCYLEIEVITLISLIPIFFITGISFGFSLMLKRRFFVLGEPI